MQSEDTHSEAKVNLARRAVACKRWRWMPGMRTTDGARVLAVDGGWLTTAVYVGEYIADSWSAGLRLAADALPDLDDPATLGCLLALVREAWGDVRIVCEWHARERGDGVQDGWWIVDESGSVLPFTGGHEAEALVAALEAAP